MLSARTGHRRSSSTGAIISLSIVLLFCTLAATETHPFVPRSIDGGRVLAQCHADLDRDGTTETVAITCLSQQNGHPMGGGIIVLHSVNGVLKPIWRHHNLNPWKLQIADVDGDGKREIVAGVWKKSPKDPVMAKRTFVYAWDGERMVPKWLGSRLSRRFDDFLLSDINKDGWDELISLEVAPAGRHRVSIYRWLVFGFEWLGCSPETPELSKLSLVDGKPMASGVGHRLEITYSEGKVRLRGMAGGG